MGKVFAVYRNGWAGDLAKLPDVIEQALGDFATRHAAMPAVIVVNPHVGDVARAALAGLGLGAELRTTGGCLLGELWLALPEGAPASEVSE